MVVLRTDPTSFFIPPGIEDAPVRERRKILRRFNPTLDSLIGRLYGNVDIYYSRGQLVGRVWPRKPKHPNSRAQLLARRAFSVMCSNWNFLGEEDKKAWHNRAKGGQRIPRDLYGKQYLDCWFTKGYWPVTQHVQSSEAFGGAVLVGGQTQYECNSELHYSHGEELDDFDVVKWWNKLCESHGVFMGTNVGNFCTLNHRVDSAWGYADDQWFIINHYDPKFYPMVYMIINRDIHGVIVGSSGLYCVSWHQDTSHPVKIVKERHGKLDPIKTWAFVWTAAATFPTVPVIP